VAVSPVPRRPTLTAAAAGGVSLLPAAGQFTPPIRHSGARFTLGRGLVNPDLMPGSTFVFSVCSVDG
jgi:hypothetical protein